MSMVGFDFGTTNSLISVIDRNGDATHFVDERNRPIPSSAGYEGTKKILGRAGSEGAAVGGWAGDAREYRANHRRNTWARKASPSTGPRGTRWTSSPT